jgi:hypothetical protein
MPSSAAVLLLLSLAAVGASAHLCLFNPHQRGELNGYETAGTPDCALLTGPCGGRSATSPYALVPRGTNYTVSFMKNLNHFYAAKPGSFVVDFAEDPEGKKFTTMTHTPDTNAPALTYYNLHFLLPNHAVRHGVLRVRYVTNNPNAPAVFYQCADFGLE